MNDRALRDHLTDFQARIEGTVGVLENHLDASAHRHHLLAREMQEIFAVEYHFAAIALEQTDNASCDC